jgi:hypothetical protein
MDEKETPSVNALFKKIVEECVKTDNIRPEYEMWLEEENILVNNPTEVYNYLLLLQFDENGWIYWFLSNLSIWCYKINNEYKNKDEERQVRFDIKNEYLRKANECNHKFAQCEYIYRKEQCENNCGKDDVHKLKQLFEEGNYRAAAYIFQIIVSDNVDDLRDDREYYELAHELLFEAIDKGDFYCNYMIGMCAIDTTNYKRMDEYCKKCLKRCYEWGAHIEHTEHITHLHTYSLYKKDLSEIAKRLISLEIPCGYYIAAFVLRNYEPNKFMQTAIAYGTGCERGCSHCKLVLNDTNNEYADIYKLFLENKELKKLQSCSLEDVVKNVISEYMEQ